MVFPQDAYDRRMFLDLYENCGELFFVAECEGEIVGYAASCMTRGGVEIVSIAVLPRRRGLGIGAALMRRTLRASAAAGARWVSLAARESNARAIAFYEGFGFERARCVPGYYHDGEAAIRMRLGLAPTR